MQRKSSLSKKYTNTCAKIKSSSYDMYSSTPVQQKFNVKIIFIYFCIFLKEFSLQMFRKNGILVVVLLLSLFSFSLSHQWSSSSCWKSAEIFVPSRQPSLKKTFFPCLPLPRLVPFSNLFREWDCIDSWPKISRMWRYKRDCEKKFPRRSVHSYLKFSSAFFFFLKKCCPPRFSVSFKLIQHVSFIQLDFVVWREEKVSRSIFLLSWRKTWMWFATYLFPPKKL